MRASNPPYFQVLPVWLTVPFWLAAFLCPTAYVALLMMLDAMQVSAPPEGLIVALFFLIPIVALLACGTMVWRSNQALSWRVTGLVLTVLGMLIQCGLWFVIIVASISAAIAPG